MKLIFNADDFGLTKGVNLGILEAFKCGVVRSTTIMAGGEAFFHAVDIAKENKDLDVGVHLTLSMGKCLGTGYNTITDSEGNFHKLKDVMEMCEKDQIDLNELENEFILQIEKTYNAGLDISHFDSHHHVHRLKGVKDVVQKLASKYGVKLRSWGKEFLLEEYKNIITTDAYTSEFYNENTTFDSLVKIIELSEIGDGSLEFMCHPAYIDYPLLKRSSYTEARVRELDTLCSTELKDYIEKKGIQIISYKEI